MASPANTDPPRLSAAEALAYAQRFFMGEADVQKAAQRLAARLSELQIPYAIAGGLAVAAHGHLRVTVDVDVLLTRDGLARFKEHSLGLGWVEKFAGSKGVRDTVNRVKVDVLLTGDFPGDGAPKPVVFPDPADVAEDHAGIRFLTLPKLIELKLASGMTAPDRLKDFPDVLELVRSRQLPREFGDQLDPFVRAKFEEIWNAAQYRGGEY